MEKVNIIDLIDKLKNKTVAGLCLWQDVSGGIRLYLKTGSISFTWTYDEMLNGYEYTMKLYDTTDQFANYHADLADDYNERLYQSFDQLRDAIITWKNAVINNKIKSLYDEL